VRKKFKQHDIVKWGPLKGIVATTSSANPDYPIQVIFMQNNQVVGFNAEGEFGGTMLALDTEFKWATKESLKLVRRPRPSLLSQVRALFSKKAKKETPNVDPPSAA